MRKTCEGCPVVAELAAMRAELIPIRTALRRLVKADPAITQETNDFAISKYGMAVEPLRQMIADRNHTLESAQLICRAFRSQPWCQGPIEGTDGQPACPAESIMHDIYALKYEEQWPTPLANSVETE